MRNVCDYGAVGDGVAKNTQIIQNVINAGGMIYFPPGVYLSGTLYLQDNVSLFLEPGAVLLASPEQSDYNTDNFCSQNRVFSSEHVSGAHFIVALGKHNISISGGGRIDGHARAWMKSGEHQNDPEWYPPWRPSQMMFFSECEDISIRDVELFDAPYWATIFCGCANVNIRGVKIHSDMAGHNGDGLDIDCCQNVIISDCNIEGSDDCITLRGDVKRLKNPKNCEDVVVTNCILKTFECGIRVGVGSKPGVIRRALFQNILVRGASVAVCVCSQWRGTNGPDISDISFHHFYVDVERLFNVCNLVVENSGKSDSPECRQGSVSNIYFSDWKGKAQRTGTIHADCGGTVSNIDIRNFDIVFHGSNANASEQGCIWYDGSLAYHSAIHVKNAENVSLREFALHFSDDCNNFVRKFEFLNCRNSKLNGIMADGHFCL